MASQAETATTLRSRYQASSFGVVTAIKYLGIVGGLFAALGILGLIGALADSKAFGSFLILGVSGAFLAAGIWLAGDGRNRYPYSSKVVLALGSPALGSGLALLLSALGVEDHNLFLITGALMIPLMGFLAYRYQNTFLLILVLLETFHWVGSWNRMFGQSTYEFDVQDPRWMAVFSLVVFGIGVWHQQKLQEKTLRFYVAYQAVALVYFNMSLLILSIDWHEKPGLLAWVLVFTLATLAQIVAGSYLKSGLLTGFGVTFAAIDLFTRYFENFWDKLDAGLFFLLGGALLLAFGFGFEAWNRGRSPESA
jgi:hypothetical protein